METLFDTRRLDTNFPRAIGKTSLVKQGALFADNLIMGCPNCGNIYSRETIRKHQFGHKELCAWCNTRLEPMKLEEIV